MHGPRQPPGHRGRDRSTDCAESAGWLECGALELDQPAAAFFLQHARVALSPGEVFDARAAHCARLNFATSQPLLAEILDRMVMAVRANQRRLAAHI